MSHSLSHRHALVTGSTAGIGLATAEGILRRGGTVTINGRDEQRLAQAAAGLRERLGEDIDLRAVHADVGTAAGVAEVLAEVTDVDILVNGAATMIFTPDWTQITDDEWFQTFETNLLAGIRLCRALLPGMIERGHGRIVFISSDVAVDVTEPLSSYSVTKTAQLGLARGLAVATARTGVTVNTVLPGPTSGDGFSRMLEMDVAAGRATDLDDAGRKFVAAHRPNSLLGRPATPEEVASMILYLVSDESLATNGAAVRVDGGTIRSIL
ncbi:MAG: SDR family oxidoreductase [Microbacterium sp.]|uniref:SDR family NAD(P)-dependent oxidoreductase n=1 Tax=Microbacterium sp. TaxID=51671 RepID=UPI0039E5ED7D